MAIGWKESMYTKSKKFKDSKTRARCKYCGIAPLHWADTEYGWQLFEKNGSHHRCKTGKGL